MDNLTHSLIGIAAGDVAYRLYKRHSAEEDKTRALFWIVSAVANNFPDLDVFYTGITPGRLGGLLHHRGHTHTFFFGIFEALFIYFLALRIFSKKSKTNEVLKSRLKKWVAALAFGGVLLHLLADSWNNYGVHPFWPLNGDWFYGDFIFIIEPLIWTFLIPVVFTLAKKKNRSTKLASIILVVLYFSVLGYGIHALAISVFTVVPLVLLFLALLFGLKMINRNFVSVVGISFLLPILGIFFVCSSLAKTEIIKNLNSSFQSSNGKSEILDLSLTPAPSNPLCWFFIARIGESKLDQKQYRLVRGTFSLADSTTRLQKCPSLFNSETVVHLTPLLLTDSNHFYNVSEFRSDFSELRRLSLDCEVDAFLKFARMPYWQTLTGDTVLLGDLRFDRGKKPSFSNILVSMKKDKTCPRFIPNWKAPVKTTEN